MSKIAKVTLSINPEFNANEIKITSCLEQIIGIKNTLNAKLEQEIMLIILKVTETEMELMLKATNDDITEDTIKGYIDTFTQCMCKNQKGKSTKNLAKHLIDKEIVILNHEEKVKAFEALAKESSEIYSKQELEVFFDKSAATKTEEVEIKKEVKTEDEKPQTGRRQNRRTKNVEGQYDSLEDVLEKLNSLVGLTEVKARVIEIINYIKNTRQRNELLNLKEVQPQCNVVIKGNTGVGKDTIADILANAFYLLGVTKHKKVIKIEEHNISYSRPIENAVRNAPGGIVYIDGIKAIIPEDGERNSRANKNLDNLFRDMLSYDDRFKFIISGDPKSVDKFMSFSKSKQIIKHEINIKDHTISELIEYSEQLASKQLYSLNDEAKTRLEKLLQIAQKYSHPINLYFAKRLIDDAIIKNAMQVDFNGTDNYRIKTISEECFPDFGAVYDNKPKKKKNTLDELNSLIGMGCVKNRVMEIINYAEVQMRRKKAGIDVEPLCLHMCFTGNPGTGKTTVARIIGKLLYEKGILQKDVFLEVSREDLVAGYVGQTEQKTANKINEAMGGVLFLDEAYSINAGFDKDYGNLVVSTLIKKMEDYRDKFVVIFAGYTNEMEKFLNMNPGLRDRVQFKIDFPDYNPIELVDIFKKFCKDNKYSIDEMSENELLKISTTIFKNRDNNFSNARMMRKLFERIKLIQSGRIIRDKIKSKKALMQITLSDIRELYNDVEIRAKLDDTKEQNTRHIGFVGCN